MPIIIRVTVAIDMFFLLTRQAFSYLCACTFMIEITEILRQRLNGAVLKDIAAAPDNR